MGKYLRILCVFLVVLSSCASASSGEHAQYETAPASHELAYEASSAQRSGNETDDRMIAYSVSVDLSVKNINETKTSILEQVKNSNGFVTRESDNYINARIPSAHMDNFVNQIKTLGKVENESKTGTDITDQYRDNVIRLNSLKSVRDRYVALLEKANSVNDILSIEKELERVNTEIEIMEGRVKYAELSVEYSNITVRYRERSKPGPVGWIFYGLFLGIKWLFVWN